MNNENNFNFPVIYDVIHFLNPVRQVDQSVGVWSGSENIALYDKLYVIDQFITFRHLFVFMLNFEF